MEKPKPGATNSNSGSSCGIIMPISDTAGYPTAHWADVLAIIKDVTAQKNIDSELVSSGNDSGIIQKRIVQNLATKDIIICDVSSKNPNVMLELGMRLLVPKPTIVIKDDKTDINFDASPIEHLLYPHDLRFNKMMNFKDQLTNKIEHALTEVANPQNKNSFLAAFGPFEIPTINTKEVTTEAYLLTEIKNIYEELVNLSKRVDISKRELSGRPGKKLVDDELKKLVLETEITNLKKEGELPDALADVLRLLERKEIIRSVFSSPIELQSYVREKLGYIPEGRVFRKEPLK